METTVFCLLMLQKYINSKQNILKLKISLVFRKLFKRFSANIMKKKTGLNRSVNYFSVDYKTFDISNIIDVHKYLIKKLEIK